MTNERPLPTVIGPTENALRALLTKTLAPTTIRTYPAWVVLNAAATANSRDPDGEWRDTVGDALKVAPYVVDATLAQLVADGLVAVDGSLTARGTVELAAARSAISATTARLIDGLSHEEQAAARRVLDHVRRRAEDLLSA